jgi:hypothetical protein
MALCCQNRRANATVLSYAYGGGGGAAPRWRIPDPSIAPAWCIRRNSFPIDHLSSLVRGPDWVCFAPSAPGKARGWRRQAAGQAFRRRSVPNPRSAMLSPPASTGGHSPQSRNWVRFAQSPFVPEAPSHLAPPGIGFVLHDWPPDAGRAAPNWVCFAQQTPRIPADRPAIGFVLHNGPGNRPAGGSVKAAGLGDGLLCPRGRLALFRTFDPAELGSFLQPLTGY